MASQLSRRGFIGSMIALFALGGRALAAGVDHARVQLGLHNPEAEGTLNAALDDSYWGDANKQDFTNALYDQIRLKPIEGGYMPMITGEGGQNFDPEVVAHVVFKRMTRLPAYMAGARAVKTLGSGWDSHAGAPYVDTFFLLDFTLFWTTYTQRMYKKQDEANQRTILFYEKLTDSMVDAATFATYKEKEQAAIDAVPKGWFFNTIIPASDIYGMFIVSPGDAYTSRVTYITKVVFDAESGWIARMGSKMPMVLKAGLKSGFVAAVKITREEQAKRDSGG